MLLATAFGVHLRTNWGVVESGAVYRSAQPSADRLRAMAANPGIKSVVNLRGEWPNASWYKAERAAAQELGMSFFDVPLFTHRLAPMKQLRQLVEIFDRAPRPILLHCHRGSDRTALAAALFKALCCNATLAEARAEYRLWHGHTGWARGRRLPHLFDLYESWLVGHGFEHSSARLREWIASTPNIGHYAAYIECPHMPKAMPINAPIALRFHITNQSARPWLPGADVRDGVHFWVWSHRPGDNVDSALRLPLPTDRVEPGATVVIEAVLPAVAKSGPLQVSADLHDIDELKFREMGEGGWNAVLEIVEQLASK